MITADELQEQLRERADAIRERKEELQSRFVEYADDPVFDNTLGLSLVGAGAGTIVFSLLKGKRSPWTFVLAGLVVVLGLSVMGGGAVSRRSGRIEEVEGALRDQLSRLDPLARARIIRDMAADQMAPFMRFGRG